MRNIKLTLEYEGTRYAGWQRQENGPSIQQEVEIVLAQILQEKVNVIGAGRTDAGVHARGQVANFRTLSSQPTETIYGGLNALLPDDIVASTVEDVPLDFHARYSAKERRYSYTITRVPHPLLRRVSWYVKYRLDPGIMQQASTAILGTHNFESFCKANADVNHHRCTVTTARWEENGDILRFWIYADRFLHGMVRALVGTMVDVGRGFTSPEEFLAIFEQKNRSSAGVAAPAKGLVLEQILY